MPVQMNNVVNFDYILVASPDKVALGCFVSYLYKTFGHGYKLGKTHSLCSAEFIQLYAENFKSEYKKGIISYYARRKANHPDPIKCIPECLLKMANIVIWMNLYDSNPIILKSMDTALMDTLLSGWKRLNNL
jgi:hypothetical protein